MAVYRVIKNKDNPYMMVNKHCIYDNRLSWKSKGLLMYFLSRPDDWEFTLKEILKHSKDGKDSTNAAIQELVDYKYISRVLKKQSGKFKGYIYEIYEMPNNDTREEKPERENRDGETAAENPPILNNNILNNELTNNNMSSNNDYIEIINYLNCKTGKSFKATTDKTKKLIKARFKEKFTVEDFKKVIDIKVKEWKGTDFEQYLRPDTLFSTKFEGYLNQKQNKKDDTAGRYANTDFNYD